MSETLFCEKNDGCYGNQPTEPIPRPILERIAVAQLTVDALVAEIRREYVHPSDSKFHSNMIEFYSILEHYRHLISEGVIVRKDVEK